MSSIEPIAPAGARLIGLPGGVCAIVDEIDYERLARHEWRHNAAKVGSGYAMRRCRPGSAEPSRVKMEWDIVGVPPFGVIIDHRNGNSLDNRRANLRRANKSQNAANAIHPRWLRPGAGYIGVAREVIEGGKIMWRPVVQHEWCRDKGKLYKTQLGAAIARDALILRKQGEYGIYNFKQYSLAGRCRVFEPMLGPPAPVQSFDHLPNVEL